MSRGRKSRMSARTSPTKSSTPRYIGQEGRDAYGNSTPYRCAASRVTAGFRRMQLPFSDKSKHGHERPGDDTSRLASRQSLDRFNPSGKPTLHRCPSMQELVERQSESPGTCGRPHGISQCHLFKQKSRFVRASIRLQPHSYLSKMALSTSWQNLGSPSSSFHLLSGVPLEPRSQAM